MRRCMYERKFERKRGVKKKLGGRNVAGFKSG